MIGIEVFRGTVLPEWIDVNKHMNVAYYVLAFDYGVDTMWNRIGITDDHIEEHASSTFAVESHVTWQREMKEAEPYVITTQLLAYDEKRIHQFMRMYHAEQEYLAATAEWINLHVDLNVRRVAPWPPHILEQIAAVADSQEDLEWPAEVGKQIVVKKPLYCMREADS